jgi:hypothetical protein
VAPGSTSGELAHQRWSHQSTSLCKPARYEPKAGPPDVLIARWYSVAPGSTLGEFTSLRWSHQSASLPPGVFWIKPPGPSLRGNSHFLAPSLDRLGSWGAPWPPTFHTAEDLRVSRRQDRLGYHNGGCPLQHPYLLRAARGSAALGAAARHPLSLTDGPQAAWAPGVSERVNRTAPCFDSVRGLRADTEA